MTRSNCSGQTPTESTTAPLNNPPLNIAAPFVARAFIIMLNDWLPATALINVRYRGCEAGRTCRARRTGIKHPELILRPVGDCRTKSNRLVELLPRKCSTPVNPRRSGPPGRRFESTFLQACRSCRLPGSRFRCGTAGGCGPGRVRRSLDDAAPLIVVCAPTANGITRSRAILFIM
jgi:hypothetical protein